MGYSLFEAVPSSYTGIGLTDIDRLPYGLLEITMDGRIIEYIPFGSQITTGELPRVCGRNLLDDILPSDLVPELKNILSGINQSGEMNRSWLVSLPFPERTVRISIVALKNQKSPRVRDIARQTIRDTTSCETFACSNRSHSNRQTNRELISN